MGDNLEEYHHNAKEKNEEFNLIKDKKTCIEIQALKKMFILNTYVFL